MMMPLDMRVLGVAYCASIIWFAARAAFLIQVKDKAPFDLASVGPIMACILVGVADFMVSLAIGRLP